MELFDSLQNVKTQLFDAPAEVKSAFNDVVEYFSDRQKPLFVQGHRINVNYSGEIQRIGTKYLAKDRFRETASYYLTDNKTNDVVSELTPEEQQKVIEWKNNELNRWNSGKFYVQKIYVYGVADFMKDSPRHQKAVGSISYKILRDNEAKREFGKNVKVGSTSDTKHSVHPTALLIKNIIVFGPASKEDCENYINSQK